MASKENVNFKNYGLVPIEESGFVSRNNPDFKSYGLSIINEEKPFNNIDKAGMTLELLKNAPGVPGILAQGVDVVRRVPQAISNVGSDVLNVAKAIPGAAVKAYGEIPQDIDFLKEAFPAAYEMIKNNPMQAAKNAGAGALEFGGRVSRAPPALVDYLAHIGMIKPETAAKFARPPSAEQFENMANQFVGDTENKGGQLLRGAVRNADLVTGGAKLASLANPLKLTNKNLAKEIVNTEAAQSAKHTNMYNTIWAEADKSGFNQVPADTKLLSDKLSVIEKYKTPREFQSLENFILDPTLSNAQKAQSDMGIISRALEEKSRKSSLTSEEKATFEAAQNAEKHIEKNMFKNAKGQTNEALQKQYKKVSNSYRENVVPYKYNPDIQAFKNDEMLAKELMSKLKGGEFRAKKGSAHPRIAVRELLKPLGIGAGGYFGTSYLIDLIKQNPANGFSGGNSNGGS